MNFSTRITDLLGIRYPILQAGMSWASSHAELALAVSQAGALGVIAAGPMYPDALRDAIRAVKAQTDRPFAVNVPLYNPRAATFLDIVIEERVPIIVASQGGPRQHIARFKQHGVTWLHVTASPEHASKAEAAGVDAVIAVGTEAGGHTGSTTSMVLWPRIVDAVAPLPVLGAGGVGRGRQMAAALALGCEGVWCGSVWLKTVESEVTPEIKAKMFEAGSEDAVLTRTVTGKPCRTLRSTFTDAWEKPGAPATLPAPLQALLWWGQGRTRVERVRAKEFLTYPVGQIVGDMRAETSVRNVVHEMLLELLDSKERLDRLLA